MIPRYTLPEMAAIWSDEARMGNWLEIEVLAVEAWAELGVVPAEDAAEVRSRAIVDVARVEEVERQTHHDVAAFVEVVAESVGEAGRWVHFGLTSSDVLDTGLALQLRAAADALLVRLEGLLGVVRQRALEHRRTLVMGRTHGVHAEPTSFGHKMALWAFELARDRERLRRAREAIAVGKLSGVVGTYSQVDPRVEERVCAGLGLKTVEAASQVIPRDRHADYAAALGVTAATLESIATEIRHLARTEVREVQEPFATGQKGSSAMPHKRNPVRSERVVGLARVVRANVSAALEDVALWHERDISHSSVERVIFPDSTMALDFMLAEMTVVVAGMTIDADRMRANIDASKGLVFSQAVLTALIERGMPREDAYALVQRAAAETWEGDADFRSQVWLEIGDLGVISEEELGDLFELEPFVARLDGVFDRLEKLPVADAS